MSRSIRRYVLFFGLLLLTLPLAPDLAAEGFDSLSGTPWQDQRASTGFCVEAGQCEVLTYQGKGRPYREWQRSDSWSPGPLRIIPSSLICYEIDERVSRQLERLELVPIRVEKGPASVDFANMTGDGREDLIVWDGAGAVTVFVAPDWRLSTNHDTESLPSERPEPGSPVLGDIDGDGLKDVVRGTDDGRVVFYRRRGVPGMCGILEFTRESRRFFPHEVGAASRPVAIGDRLAVGSLDGGVRWYERPRREWVEALDANIEIACGFDAPAFGDLDGSGPVDLVFGRRDGGFGILLRDRAGNTNVAPSLDISAGEFSSPCLVDLDGDGDLDLLSGNRDGKVLCFRNTGTVQEPSFELDTSDVKLAAIDVGDSSAPTAGDVDGDGDVDLIVGNQKGELHLFLGPDWKEDESAFKGLDVGELSTPALVLDRKGKLASRVRLVVGRLAGDVLLYEAKRVEDGGIIFVERDSWSFTPDQKSKTIEDYYRNCYFPEEEEVRGPNDPETFKAYCDLLATTPKPYVDEVTFTFVHTPAEVLRAMARLGQANLLLENAKAVYEMAEKVPYAKIVEKDGYTTLAYAKESGEFVEAPPDIYYWWVVHPRLLYEIPSRIVATWWDKRADERGLTDSEWWKHKPETDIHAPSDAGVFWRPAIVHDARYGGSLFERVAKAKTLREAQMATHLFLVHGPGLMRFGYETQDMQPWLIYAKYYGSCGEHSIIGAACARTLLIPATVVTDRGEDHQWNEWWDVDGHWHHWDCCHKDGVDTPWSSTEGREHKGKTVSSVTRWWGDGRLEATTATVFNDPAWKYTKRNAGYTDVAEVTVRVVDRDNTPIDGALVIVRSHWDNRNMVSIWGYTDGEGRTCFDLGYEPNGGYTIEVLTPFGSAGVQSFTVEENRAYELVFRIPKRKPGLMRLDRVGKASSPPVKPARERTARLVKSELRPPCLITSTRFRIGSYMTDEHGYRGTRGQAIAIDPGDLVEVFIFSPEEFEKFTSGGICTPLHRSGVGEDGRLRWPHWEDMPHVVVFSNLRAVFMAVEIDLEADPAGAVEDRVPPTLHIAACATSVDRGATLEIGGKAEDDVSVAGLSLRCSAWVAPRDVTADLDRSTGEFRVVLDTGEGGPWPAGEYEYTLVARDRAGNETVSDPLVVTVKPARIFKAQKIRQDDADDPLKKCSWIYGPFELDGTDRFFLMRAKSLTDDFDCDVHLYRDKNGNGRVDGQGERVAKSTSPTANERIYLENPSAGTYWLYCQGWKVEGDFAPLDVEIYPTGKPRAVVDIEPAGRLADLPPRIAARFLPFARIDPKTVRVIIDGNALVEGVEVDPRGVTVSLGKMIARDRLHTVALRVRYHSGREETRTWTFVVDTKAPELEILSPEPGSKVEGKVRIEVVAVDEGPGVKVVARLAGEKERAMKPVKDRPGVFALEVDTKDWKTGERFIWFVARDAVGNELERVLRVVR